MQLFELLPDVSFFMKDRECRFVALNRRGCEYCGVKTERDAIGRTDADFFSQSRAKEYMADDRAVMKSGQPILDRIEPAPEMEGSPRLVVTSKIPLRNERNQVIGVAGFSRHVEQVKARSGSMDRLSQALDYLHQCHAEHVPTATLARIAGVSRSQFERVFRATIGTTPRQYLVRIRVEAACRALKETDHTIAAIAQQCGFYDHAHFTRCFRSVMGVTPSQFRDDRKSPPKERRL